MQGIWASLFYFPHSPAAEGGHVNGGAGGSKGRHLSALAKQDERAVPMKQRDS